ncbi:MAG: hypothetical protein NC453_11265 [Muribaculum sp.]|nr:hypothetical protein [Muribaculum sp.]
MKYPSLQTLKSLKVASIPTECLAEYAYALNCLKMPASVVNGEWYHKVDDICSCKIAELQREISRRLSHGEDSTILTHAMAVLDGSADLIEDTVNWNEHQPLSQMTISELIEMHSMSRQCYEMRRSKGLEVFTRSYQWQIVTELLNRKESGLLALILQLTEFIETDGYAHNLSLPYNIGEDVKTFAPSDYPSDEDLRSHINELVRKADYVSREELIQIADYIQAEIVEKGETVNHIELVNAILCTGMPSFDYPVIVKDFEQTIKSLAKSDEKKDIELAPYFYSLWGLTLKPIYLSRFEKTVRQCYLTLASNKHYPNLGINKEDSASLSSALRFLNEYRMNVWIINDKYDVDKVIAKYKTA